MSAASRHIIERPRLTRRLDEATAKVITLVAPAGYGKTTLARQWLADRPHSWYTASTARADVGALGLGLIQSAETAAPGVGSRFREWLHTRRGTEGTDLAADLLADDLAALPPGTWIVLDDYQYLSAAAENVIDRLSGLEQLRLLITSRRRPTWVSPRALLYGQVHELGQCALAMTDDEASQVLAGIDGEAARDLILLAKGWPAVIALASFAERPPLPSDGALPPALHGYVADELYASVARPIRMDLAKLALLPVPSRRLARDLLGPRSEHVLAEGLRVGFLTEEAASTFSIHPLLRNFLREKLADLPSDDRDPVLSEVMQLLVTEKCWGEALEILKEFHAACLLKELVGAALYDLLDQGLLATVAQYVEFGHAHRIESAVLDLAEAELAFREGFHDRARALAEQGAARFAEPTPFASRALCLAGHCAYFADEVDAAIEQFFAAKALAVTRADERAAVWGLFISAIEKEDDAAVALLEEFEEMSGGTVDELIRVQNGRLHVGMRLGSLSDGLSGAEAIAEITPQARDPVVRTSFWHIYAGALRAAGAYASAQRASSQALREIATFDLDFARAHVYLTQAGVHAGLRAHSEALALLDEVARIGQRNGDVFLQMNERTMRCRVCLSIGDVSRARRATDVIWPHVGSSGQYAEFLACRALSVGMLPIGHEDPFEILVEAERRSRENEASCLCACVRALLTVDCDPVSARKTIVDCFSIAAAKGILDPLVFAFRLDARLSALVDEVESLRPALQDLLPIIHGSGVEARQSANNQLFWEAESLTRREREVLELVALGETNKEIATRLFLTLGTVKVHVRHILRKLGLRSRTEAAIYAVKMQQQREGAASHSPRESTPLQPDSPT